MLTSFNAHSTRARRAGISLLEIMISIGVVGIGLIGVAALIPLAHHKAAQGVEQDRMTLLGKRAFREFRVRGMDVLYNLADMNTPAILASDPNFNSPADPDKSQTWKYQPFCIDPIVFSHQDNSGQVSFPFFPAQPQGEIRVPRKTILAGQAVEPPPGYPQAFLMGRPQAFEVFTLHDDFDIKSPEGQNPPELLYLDAAKIAANGSYSWIAFVVPSVGGMSRVSVVVFHRRWLNLDDDSYRPRELEALVNDPVLIGGIKSVRLVGYEDYGEFNLSKLKSGDWVLIATQGNPPSRMAWYRVLMVDPVPKNEPPYEVNLSLEGPDWEGGPATLYAGYAEGVVAVYEKTIRMQGASLYQ